MALVDDEIAALMAQLHVKQQEKKNLEERQRSELQEEDSRRRLEESGLKERYEQYPMRASPGGITFWKFLARGIFFKKYRKSLTYTVGARAL